MPRNIVTLAFLEPTLNDRPLSAPNETTISVIIPVHNGGDGFRACLLSLRAADPPPFVVADGDNSVSSEDIELGYRLRQSGYPIELVKDGLHFVKGLKTPEVKMNGLPHDPVLIVGAGSADLVAAHELVYRNVRLAVLVKEDKRGSS